MSIDQLLHKIEAAISTVLIQDGAYTGSLTLEIHFKDGVPKDIIKQVERTRTKINN